MASVTDSTSSEGRDAQLRWDGRWTLTHRILALNVLTVLLVALSTLYLDVFRHRLSKERTQQTRIETATAATALAQRPGVVKTRNQLLDVAYSDDVYVDDRTIDSHIKRIRRKFRSADPEFDAIETLYGVGYRFDEQ